MKHHVPGAGTLFSSGDVVPDDEVRGVKHHVRATEDSFSSEDVVPGDEGIRVCER